MRAFPLYLLRPSPLLPHISHSQLWHLRESKKKDYRSDHWRQVTTSSRVHSYAWESGNKKEQIITNKQIWPRGWSEGNSEVSFCLSSLLIARLHSIFACIKILKRSRIFLGIHYPLAFRTKHLFAMSRCMKLFYEIARVDFFIIRRFFTHHSKNILTQ